MVTVNVTPELLEDLSHMVEDADRWDSMRIFFHKNYNLHDNEALKRINRIRDFIQGCKATA